MSETHPQLRGEIRGSSQDMGKKNAKKKHSPAEMKGH
jgi:hypothetical protein